MNATIDMAETIERAAWTDLIDAVPPALREQLGLETQTIGEATVMTCAAGGILLNRTLGATARTIEAVAAAYRARGIGGYFVHVYDQSAELERAAREAGLQPYRRAWVKLLRGNEPPPEPSTDLAVGSAATADGPAAGRVFAAAFDMADAFAGVISPLIGRDQWEVVVARDGAELAAMGLLYRREGVGYLAGAATAPSYRRRGAQGALMIERIRRAIAGGCRWIVTETGEAVQGDPQHSYRNMIRCGFEVVGRRQNFAPIGMSWNHGRRKVS